MTHRGCSPNVGAIQIINSLETGDTKQKQHIIHVIEEYQDNEGKRGPSLKHVLCEANKYLPIFVISICGKTRTGKSLLLNLMIKYLEAEKYWRDGLVPNVFEWKGGATSVTRGLWICPKIFKRVNKFGKEIGILLLDNQGLFDGEQTDGVSVAISGISTALSFYQMYNVKDNICENDLESIWRHLMMSDETFTPEECTIKLMFVVRDYLEEDHGCGLKHGRTYIENEKLRGTDVHKDTWKGLQKTFPDISCVLLPFPGTKVRIGAFKEMKDIETEFLDEVEKFFGAIFDVKHLRVTKNIPTGQMIYEKLQTFNGKVADESLSFVNVFTEQGNGKKFDSIMNNFESEITQGEPLNGQYLIKEFLTMGKKKFKGKSADEYLVKLEQDMTKRINHLVKDWILKEYKTCFEGCRNAESTHKLEWKSVKHRIACFVGSDADKNEFKGRIITGCAETYYSTFRKELETEFNSNCENKTLDQLAGYDEEFISIKFNENPDFMPLQPKTKQQCNAIWVKEKDNLHTFALNKLLQCVGAQTSVELEWLQKATKTQFMFYETFTWNDCHVIKIEKCDDSLIELVGYTMYQTVQKPDEYSEKQKNDITRISEQIKEQSSYNPITLTVIFIICHHKGNTSCEPVFKVKNGHEFIFIDIKGRAYKNWNDFHEDNKLPSDCLYCYPSQGEYSKEKGFRVGFKWSPDSSSERKALKVLDDVLKVAGIASTGVLGAVAFLPAAPVLAVGGAIAAGTSGAYGLTRGIIKIVDKIKHDQTVKATDAVDVIANSLSVVTAGATAGATLMTTIGRELVYAPAIIQGISSLTNLVFQFDTENICYLSLANDISMFLLFNNKLIEGAIDNIRKSYNLQPKLSNLGTLKTFITRNSITFPTKDGDRLTTDQFFSTNLKSLLITALRNKSEERSLQFLKNVTASSKDLKPLHSVFSKVSQTKEQIKFFEVLFTLIDTITCQEREKTSVKNYCGMEYHPANEVSSDIALAGVCTGFTDIAECPGEEIIKLVCNVAKVLKFAYDNAETNDLEGLTAFLIKEFQDIVLNYSQISKTSDFSSATP